ncbi:MAG TPA: alginate lyase family protein [Usitatibacter sp.]
MSAGLAWKLNRLRCMSTAEIGHRVARAAVGRAERWGFVRCWVPPARLSNRAKPWVHADAGVDALPYVAAADRVLDGRFDVFALLNVELGNPPRWNRDPKTGIEAPLEFGKELDYRDASRVGDCKYLWEPNRHLHLVTLAQAHAMTGDARYAETVRMHLESWFDACPFRMGAQWSSSLEPALRLINWALAWQLLGGLDSPLFEGDRGAAFRDRWLESVYQHAAFISGHLSLHSSANNHLVGEVAGLYTAGVAWPHWEMSARWRGTAKEILEREALLQNAPDGVNREQATSYQQFELDLLLLPLLAGRANGDDFSPAYVARIEAMLVFIASVMDQGGNMPMFGDADDGYVVRLDPRTSFCRYRSLLASGALLFSRGDFKAKAAMLDDKTRWLFGSTAARAFDSIDTANAALPIRREFPEGGYYVLGTDFESPSEIRLVADAGPLGYREIAAHGHADALSFTLSLGGDPFLVDPGTFAYHTEAQWRSYFRGTSAHNTLRVDGQDQSQPGGNFMWLRKAAAACTRWEPGAGRDLFEARHDGYMAMADPVMHQRRIVLDKVSRRIGIDDTLEMDGVHEIELFLHCHEECLVTLGASDAQVRRGERSIHVSFPTLPGSELTLLEASTNPIGGWISHAFDRKAPAPTLAWRAQVAGPVVLHSEIAC